MERKRKGQKESVGKMGKEEEDHGHLPLFETKEARGRVAHKLFAASIFTSVILVLVYRWTHVPPLGGGSGTKVRWAWYGMFAAEVWFGFYWILSQALRWRPVFRSTFKDRLSQRYEKELPGVDIFVCTADPKIEPPSLVINTVLSVMAYDYPPEKLSVYLSDDGGSDLTLYALVQASHFAKHWLPFCRRFKIKPRSPAAYFSKNATTPRDSDDQYAKEWLIIKKLYEDMESRIETVTKLGRVPKDIRAKHERFIEWSSTTLPHDHHTILDILFDGKDPKHVDDEGHAMPTLVYLAREKRPQRFHNFKAGSMNALIRVSSEISNGPIILNVDCDMYSNNPETIRDALCFFMDEKKGHEIAYVQLPQCFNNITKNDLYNGALPVLWEAEFPGLDGFGGPFYAGTGCFHRRESLCGRRYTKDYKAQWTNSFKKNQREDIRELEARVKRLADCDHEENTQWGKEMGLKYGCVVEDVITGLSIQCKGWKSVYYTPSSEGFVGVAPITLEQSLVQHKRWAEGDLQFFLSEHFPFSFGYGKISVGLQLGYCHYNLWALNYMPMLYYVIVPSLFLLNGVSLFPKISSLWFIPFGYVILANYTYSVCEMLWCGKSLKTWLNYQRMTLFKRTSSYLFSVIDTVLRLLGISKSVFVVTSKVADEEVLKRYQQEVMEFGSSSPMFAVIATVAWINLLSLGGAVARVVMHGRNMDFEGLILQFLLCCGLLIINMPVYEAIFIRRDKGRLPAFLSFTSLGLALLLSSLFMQ